MQLVAYGAQDVYLTGNPQITFFKVVYRRHTNFSIESIEQTFSGQADFGKKVQCTVSRNGDLIGRTYLQVQLPALAATNGTGTIQWVSKLGETLIDNVNIEIGGQEIDKQYGDWLHIWSALSLPTGQKDGYASMIGDISALTVGHPTLPSKTLYIPLQFWYARNPGLALPLIALQYHEVKFNLQFRPLSDLIITTPSSSGHPVTWIPQSMQYASIYIDYIYLDTDERRRFAQVSHEYLIEQVQFTGDESVSSSSNKIRLNFNHPVKELIWVVQTSDAVDAQLWDNYNTNAGANPVVTAKLQLNGHDRFSERFGDYFALVQPFQHHTNIPSGKSINVYSFGLKPEEHQPSGTCNFSRIDNATLNLQLDNTVSGAVVRIFAVNYNVLRIMSGINAMLQFWMLYIQTVAIHLCSTVGCRTGSPVLPYGLTV